MSSRQKTAPRNIEAAVEQYVRGHKRECGYAPPVDRVARALRISEDTAREWMEKPARDRMARFHRIARLSEAIGADKDEAMRMGLEDIGAHLGRAIRMLRDEADAALSEESNG